jgi:hypothetical protein
LAMAMRNPQRLLGREIPDLGAKTSAAEVHSDPSSKFSFLSV